MIIAPGDHLRNGLEAAARNPAPTTLVGLRVCREPHRDPLGPSHGQGCHLCSPFALR